MEQANDELDFSRNNYELEIENYELRIYRSRKELVI